MYEYEHRLWKMDIFIQINMPPLYTKTACLSEKLCAFSIEDGHLQTYKHAVLHQKIRLGEYYVGACFNISEKIQKNLIAQG